MWIRRRASGRLAGLVVVLLAPLASAGEPAFSPCRHLPTQGLLRVHVPSGEVLARSIAETLPGRILGHPGVRRGCARLGALLAREARRAWTPVERVTGLEVGELARLLGGELALSVGGPAATGGVDAILSVELGPRRSAIDELLDRLRARAEEASGGPLETRRVEGVEVTVWPGPIGPVLVASVGGHLLVAASTGVLEATIRRWKDDLADGSTRDGETEAAEIRDPLHLDRPLLRVDADVAGLRALLLPLLALSGRARDARSVVEFTGLDGLSSIGFGLGACPDGLEVVVHLGTPGGPRGLLEALGGALARVEHLEPLLAHVPAGFTELRVVRVAPGRVLRQLDRLVRKTVPELAGFLDDAYGSLESAASLSVCDDLWSLEPLTLLWFDVPPPSGGLLADSLLVVRADELLPYRRVAARLIELAGGRVASIEVDGGRIECADFSEGLFGEGTLLERIVDGGGVESPSELQQALIAASTLVPFLQVARADLPEGWVVLSPVPASIRRYLTIYRRGPLLAGDAELSKQVTTALGGCSAGAYFRSGGRLLWAYNTLLSLGSPLSPLLAQAGIDVLPFPPGEVFAQHARPGWLRVDSGPDGCSVRGARLLTSSGNLVGAGLVSAILAAVALPALADAREEAHEAQSRNNLRGLYHICVMHAQEQGVFPYDERGSLAALDRLADQFVLDPSMFVRPGGPDRPAPSTGSGAEGGSEFTLTPTSCSYEIVAWPLRHDADALLLWEKAPFRGGRRLAIDTRGRLLELPEDTFRNRLETERRRHAPGR